MPYFKTNVRRLKFKCPYDFTERIQRLGAINYRKGVFRYFNSIKSEKIIRSIKFYDAPTISAVKLDIEFFPNIHFDIQIKIQNKIQEIKQKYLEKEK